MISLDIKLAEGARAPEYATDGSNGLDLFALNIKEKKNGIITYDTGISVAIPTGYAGLLLMRSSVHKTDVTLRNAVGLIDSDYRGPILLKYSLIHFDKPYLSVYKPGDKIGQLLVVPSPKMSIKIRESLPDTARVGGFGSTDIDTRGDPNNWGD